MDLRLHGKVALVTGSSKGIGEAIAMALAREGATVIVHGRDMAQAERVRSAIAESGGCAHAVLADLTSDTEVEAMIDAVCDCVGGIDILVNNAGGSGMNQDWSTTEPAAWTATHDRNVLATVWVTKGFLTRMCAALGPDNQHFEPSGVYAARA